MRKYRYMRAIEGTSPLPLFTPVPSEVDLLNPDKESGDCCELQQGLHGRSLRRNISLIWCILALKFDIWYQEF